ncbi:hypothetical protein ACFELO_05775 [Oceanicaulis sp. LC35]|uniref:hypothetical protein n=1 Tax=Oceanicaulis sp. LC35 TaxID=3349635 RepID=UPI003F86B5FE
MRIIEEGHDRVIVDVGEAFTHEGAQQLLQFVSNCSYRNRIRLLVIPGVSHSQLSETESVTFGHAMSALLKGGMGRIAVVYDPGSERQELEYTLIDTTISLQHRLIAQFHDVDEARSWLDWDLITPSWAQTG